MKEDSPLDKAQDIIQENPYRTITVLTAAILTTGSLFYHLVEKLSWLDAIYFSVVTLATVGYGDITPKTDAGKIFTCFYVLIGIGIIVAFTTSLLKRAEHRHLKRKARKKKSS